MSPAIAKLEALLSRVQQNRTKPRTSALGVATPALRAQPLALDEPLHLPPAELVATDLASALGAAPVAVTPSTPEVARHPAPVEDEEPEITLGAGAGVAEADEDEDEEEDDALDTGERVAVEAPARYTEPPAAAAAAVHIAPTPTPPLAPAAPPRTSAQPVARAPGPPPLRPTASPAVEARSATPAHAPVAPPASEELPTTTREAPQRRAIEAAPLPASAAVAKITGAAAAVPRTFGALVARTLALRPKRS